METITVEQIIDLIINKHGEELMKDLVILRMMGYSKEVIDALFVCYEARGIEVDALKKLL